MWFLAANFVDDNAMSQCQNMGHTYVSNLAKRWPAWGAWRRQEETVVMQRLWRHSVYSHLPTNKKDKEEPVMPVLREYRKKDGLWLGRRSYLSLDVAYRSKGLHCGVCG